MESSKIKTVKKIFNLAIGPLLYLLIINLPIVSLPAEAKLAMALYVWIIAWWITKPVPWAVTSLLPLIIIPMAGLMKIGSVAELYGQRILFFLIGVLSLGQAVSKYHLGDRISLSFLSQKNSSKSIIGILFRYLAVVMVISACIDDAATIAICIPIGLSIAEYVKDIQKKAGKEGSLRKLQTFVVLGTLYAAEAGGIMSIAGIPHIPVTISILEKITGISINFFEWSRIGIPIGIVSFLLYFLILRLMFKPEVNHIENAADIFSAEKNKLGKLSSAEKYVIFVFILMIALWMVPNFVKVPFLDVWMVPVIATVFLYLLPNGKGESLLDQNDFVKELPWNTIFLILGGGVMASLSNELGLVEWMQSLISTELAPVPLMLLASVATATLSNFVSGTAAVSITANIFFPIVWSTGLNPVTFAFILPASGMAIMFPWAGAATGTTFATGKVDIRDMIRCGFAATVIHILACIGMILLCTELFY